MSISTAIEWCDSTVNPQMGCDGCELWNPKAGLKHCYAGTLTARHAGKAGWPAAFDQPALFPERIKTALKWPDLTGKERPEKPWLSGLPRLIFLNDMGDTFTESLPVDWLAPLLPQMADSPHVWMLLTKRPRRMRQFFELHSCPANFWLYTSVTDQATARARIPELLQIDGATVRGISAEPLLGPLDLRDWLRHPEMPERIVKPGSVPIEYIEVRGLNHIIAGGESGHGARPSHPDWFMSLQAQCEERGVPFFFKQWGQLVPLGHIPAGALASAPYGSQRAYDGMPDFAALGKKAAGRLLDGRTWSQFPEVAP